MNYNVLTSFNDQRERSLTITWGISLYTFFPKHKEMCFILLINEVKFIGCPTTYLFGQYSLTGSPAYIFSVVSYPKGMLS